MALPLPVGPVSEASAFFNKKWPEFATEQLLSLLPTHKRLRVQRLLYMLHYLCLLRPQLIQFPGMPSIPFIIHSIRQNSHPGISFKVSPSLSLEGSGRHALIYDPEEFFSLSERIREIFMGS